MVDPRLAYNDMSFWAAFTLFVLVGFGIVASLADCYYTGIGLSKGFKEGNPVFKLLMKKMGLAEACFVTTAAYIFTAGLMSMVSHTAAYVYAAGIAGLEVFNALRNRKLVSK